MKRLWNNSSSQNISSQNISSQNILSQNISSQNIHSQNILSQNISSQNIHSQNISSQNISSQNISSQNIHSQLHHNFNKLSDRYFTKLFIRPSFTTILSQQLYSNMENIFHHKLQRIIFEKHLCYCSSNIFNTTSFTNSLLQSLSDRCFDKLFTNIQMSYIFHHKLFTNIQMSYIFHHKHSQTLYHEF